jgi:hypothetical protein
MNIAIAICSVVLGGVLIPDTDPTVVQPGLAAPQGPLAGFGFPEIAPSYSAPAPASQGREEGYPVPMPGDSGPQRSYPLRRSGPADAGQGMDRSLAPGYPLAPFDDLEPSSPLIPFAPTNPSAAGEMVPWAAPTAGSPAEGQVPQQRSSAGAPLEGYSSSGASAAGAYLRPSATRPQYRVQSPYEDYVSRQPAAPRAEPVQSPAYPSVTSAAKPYRSYTRPSAISPYMELGRITSYYDDVDNYNQYVRPRLEQMETGQRLDRQIRGLQNTMQTLSRQTQNLRGVTIPQYYMNYGSYYPAFNR